MFDDNVDAMSTFDNLVLAFCAALVGMSAVAELRDIDLCMLTIDRADLPVPTGWRVALRTLANLRHYMLLPLLVANVPMLVLFGGGDGELPRQHNRARAAWLQ